MSDGDEIERIKAEKLERLLERDGDASGDSEGSATAGGDSPSEPVAVRGEDHLGEIVEAHESVLVDFYADWCGPCKQLAPVLEELAAERAVTVAKVDVDGHQALAGQYGVRGVPTLVLFSDGEVAERVTGARPKAQLEQLLDRHA